MAAVVLLRFDQNFIVPEVDIVLSWLVVSARYKFELMEKHRRILRWMCIYQSEMEFKPQQSDSKITFDEKSMNIVFFFHQKVTYSVENNAESYATII